MTLEEANKIINEYEKVLARGTVGETILRKLSWLTFSKAKVKYAYFVLLEDLVKKGQLDKQKDNIIENYSLLNTFVDDFTADKYAKNYEEWQAKKSDPFRSKKDESLVKQYIAFTHYLRGDDTKDEIKEFIDELER